MATEKVKGSYIFALIVLVALLVGVNIAYTLIMNPPERLSQQERDLKELKAQIQSLQNERDALKKEMERISSQKLEAPQTSTSLPSGQAGSTLAFSENTLSVSGVGKVLATPDMVTITISVVTEEEDAEAAIKENSVKMNQVIKALKELGLEDKEIKTSGYSLYPKYIYPENKEPRVVGYIAQNTITINTKKLDLAGQIIDKSVESGANRVESVYFTFSDERKMALNDKLITLALENAKKKAEVVVNTLGIKIVGVKSVQISEFVYSIPIYRTMIEKVAGAEVPPPTPIVPGEESLTLVVNIVFLIE
ncbi:MAG: SIMPL domain-containing protein [Nitrososphaerales archaeon]